MRKKAHRLADAAVVLSAAALVVCVIMTVHTAMGIGLIGCSSGSACHYLLKSRWATMFGIVPVSSIAAGIYLVLVACFCFIRFQRDSDLIKAAYKMLPVIAGAIAGAAVWFIGLMIFQEKSICKLCFTVHTIGILQVLILMKYTKFVRHRWGLFSRGVLLAVLLAVTQFVTAPDYIYQKGRTEEPLPVVRASQAPVVGDPSTADYVIELLYDYQCSHCQKVHLVLPEVVEAFEGKVAFVLCPCPLCPKCNPYVLREEARFEGSCELAQLAIATYHCDPEAFRKFDSWMLMNRDEDGWWPRGVEDARAYAEALVGGADVLDEALDDGFAASRLLETYEIFGRTSNGGKGGIPRFIYGESWVVPEADNAEDIKTIIANEFGIQ